MEISDLMSFSVHEDLVEKLFTEYQRQPPVGWANTSLQQLLDADREAFKLLSDAMQGNCGRNPATGKRFADEVMADVLVMRSFTDRLAPLPTASRPPASSSGGGVASVNEGATKRKLVRDNAQMKEQLKRMRAEDVKPKAALTKGKAQPKKSGDPRMPKEL
eukprot:6460624-Amphidinium_carterae.1